MRKKILAIDKDKDILEIVTYILSEKGYHVLSLRTEDGALKYIQEFNPDIILLDIVKPSEEGTKLCRSIKAHKYTKHIPVIVFSTHSKVAAIKEVCADDILPKPFDITDLLDIVEKQLSSAG